MNHTRRHLFIIIAGLLLVGSLGAQTAQAVCYVNVAATGANSGADWANAYTSLHSALANAACTEIWVARGVYYASPSFELKTGVAIYGGFAGTETLLTERDWEANTTILSGDIEQNDVNTDGNFIAETWADMVGTNAGSIVVADSVDATARLDGFTVTAGSHEWPYGGGGIYNVDASPSYANLVISGNQGGDLGGGIFNSESSPRFEHVLIRGNRAFNAYSNGGGMYSLYGGSPTLLHVTFDNNYAERDGGGFASDGGSPSLEDVTFSNNRTGDGYGGGINFMDGVNATLKDVRFIGNQSYMGGGLYIFRNGSLTMTDVVFRENTARDDATMNSGGGMAIAGDITVNAVNVSFIGNTAADCGGGVSIEASSLNLTNALFLGNRAVNRLGGGVGLLGGSTGSTVALTNATFSGNRAAVWTDGTPMGGAIGIELYSSGHVTATNSILWGNSPNEVYTGNSTFSSSYSNVQQASGVYPGTGNINSDPLFVTPVDAATAPTTTGDLRLQAGSPASNAGNNSALPVDTYDLDGDGDASELLPLDLERNVRITNSVVDMGAYEYFSQLVLYASPGGLTSGGCSNWTNACELRYALNKANAGQEIWVAAGTYTPTSGAERDRTFQLKNGVAVYGGFDGTETARDQRDPAVNVVLLSGDLNGDDVGFANNGENSYHVVTGATGATLDGVTVSGGNANAAADPHYSGGGMYNYKNSPTVTNVIFRGNVATNSGGGMYNRESSPTVTGVTFSGNSANFGGGMLNTYSNPTLTAVTFSGNSATSSGSAGGGIFGFQSSPTLTNVTISGNSGSGISNISQSSPQVRNSILWGNTPSQISNSSDSATTVSDSVVQDGYASGTDIITADPLLGALGDYGGSMPTIPLLPGSSAINAGNAASCTLGHDQRGISYVAACDIGAFESQGFTLAITGGDNQSTPFNAEFSNPLTASITSDFNEPVNGGQVTFTPPTSGASAVITVSPATISGGAVSVTATANGTGGSYSVTASATGATSVDFSLTNIAPSVTIAVSPASVVEDDAANLSYTLTRTGGVANALTVNISVGGTAAFSTDYTQSGADTFNATTGTATFAAGSSTATVTIDPAADTTVEPDETVILTVTAGTGYTVGDPAGATGAITNDDTSVSLAVTPASVVEDGAANLIYTLTRSGVTTNALTVNFSVGGTAAFTMDYAQSGAAAFSATTGTVTFAANSSTTTVTLDPAADTTVEPDETVILTLTAGTGYTVGTPASATGAITNDDTSVSLAVNPASVTEDGAANLAYTLTRSGVTTNALTVNLSVGGTAAFTTDYAQTGAATFDATTGTITFTANSSTATVTIDPVTDSAVEPDETVILTVTAGTGYTVGSPASATGTITNDDATVSVTVSPASVMEDGTDTLTYTLSRSGFLTNALTVNISVGGTAAFTTDYTQSGAASFSATTGTVTFAANSSTATVTLDPAADTTVEPDETVILTLTAGAGYTVVTPGNATGTITDDDTSGFSVSETTAAVSEAGTTDTFTVVLTAQPLSNVVFTVTSSDAGEATASPAALTFTNGNWSTAQTVTVTGVNDAVTDGTQTSVITVSVNDALSDDAFDALADKTVTVTTADNDRFLAGQWQDAAQTAANTDDDDLCWAAAASNLLQWGGWGTTTYNTAQKIFAKFQYHWTDYVGKMYDGWKWWVDGTAPGSRTTGAKVNVGGWTGAYIGQYSAEVYVKSMVGAESLLLNTLNTAFTNLFGVTLGLLKGTSSHALTVWGYETGSSGELLGLHVTDSADGVNQLVYAPVQYNTTTSYWELTGGYSGWRIRELDAFGTRADGKTNSVFGGAGTITGVNYAGGDSPSTGAAIPEPASLVGLSLGLLALGALLRKRGGRR